MVKEAYCSFEVAKLLKEKGFNEPCRAVYEEKILRVNTLCDYFNSELSSYICAPTHQMAMAWLREVHNIHIELNPICYGDTEKDLRWHYGWAVKTTIFTDRWKRHNAEHISYEQACEAALKYVFENLI